MLGWLKKLFSGRGGLEVEYGTTQGETPLMPAGPPTMPYPPAAPLDRPDEADEADRPT